MCVGCLYRVFFEGRAVFLALGCAFWFSPFSAWALRLFWASYCILWLLPPFFVCLARCKLRFALALCVFPQTVRGRAWHGQNAAPCHALIAPHGLLLFRSCAIRADRLAVRRCCAVLCFCRSVALRCADCLLNRCGAGKKEWGIFLVCVAVCLGLRFWGCVTSPALSILPRIFRRQGRDKCY